LPFEEMVRLDLFYIENWSLLLDLKIILRTALVILRGDGY
jgi:lipopolysaccharide/colanic/teichoic acid biosynthesis glycosyltransferase